MGTAFEEQAATDVFHFDLCSDLLFRMEFVDDTPAEAKGFD